MIRENYHAFIAWFRPRLALVEWRIAIKAGIAATVSLILGVSIATLTGRPGSLISGTWSVLSTFIVLQAHLGGTYRAAGIRLVGVIVGCLLGGFFASIFGSNPFTLGISVTLAVIICSMLNLKDSIRIACLSLCIVMILWRLKPELSPWLFSLYRFIDSLTGIFVAVVVTHTLWPTEAEQKMRLTIVHTLHSLSTFYRSTLNPSEGTERSLRKLNRQIFQLLKEDRTFLEASRLELLTRTANIEDWRDLIENLTNIYRAIPLLMHFTDQHLDEVLDKALASQLKDLIEKTDYAFQNLSRMLETGKTALVLGELRQSLETLDEELSRFRTTRKTHDFSFSVVERFFVFFYHLRVIVEELLKFEAKTRILNE